MSFTHAEAKKKLGTEKRGTSELNLFRLLKTSIIFLLHNQSPNGSFYPLQKTDKESLRGLIVVILFHTFYNGLVIFLSTLFAHIICLK